MSRLLERASLTRYHGYAYAYPHKTAYRQLCPAPSLTDVWRNEAVDALLLYVHVPFCNMRCGFCNLFTAVGLDANLEGRYVDALERQAWTFVETVARPLAFSRLAIGGGTPTLLSPASLRRVLALVRRLGADPERLPTSVEASPGTTDDARLAVLREAQVSRISLGVQSFVPSELRALGRAEDVGVAIEAIRRIRRAGFPELNVDLIYGVEGQTEASFLESLQMAIEYGPEQIFLYPLYVRPLTGLGKRRLSFVDHRARLYDVGRDFLLARGYRQHTMRLFSREGVPDRTAPEYSCQDDGTVGLGVGARSYTQRLHYSFEYAVSRGAVREIVDRYIASDRTAFSHALVGFALDEEDSRRRYAIQSILSSEGLDRDLYFARFGSDALDSLPVLEDARTIGWLESAGRTLRLTHEGYAHADTLGPALYSSRVDALSLEYELR